MNAVSRDPDIMPNISISTAVFDGYPLDTAFETLASMDVRWVEPAYIRGYVDFDESAFSDASAQAFTRKLTDFDIEPSAISAHLNLGGEDALAALRRRVAFAAKIGAPFLISNAGPRTAEPQILRVLDAIAHDLEASKVTLALENPGHGANDVFGLAADGARLIKKLDNPHIRLNYDFGNVYTYSRGETLPEVDMADALPFMVHAHIKDIKTIGEDWAYVAIGEGDIHYDVIARQSPDLPISIELPLRLQRAAKRDPVRAPEPLALSDIKSAIRLSLDAWQRVANI